MGELLSVALGTRTGCVKLSVEDKCMGMLEAVGEVFPEAKYQRCVVHFYRSVFSVVPKFKVKLVAKMLKADPWAGEQKSIRREGKGCRSRAQSDEAEGNGEKDRGQRGRDTNQLRLSLRTPEADPHKQRDWTPEP